ncbi:MAG: ABC transporter substrate-binding protein [Proteobacteria bacterium]|nr:ABC transporter substrate-binding protein [Pseudomonadota bacterium]
MTASRTLSIAVALVAAWVWTAPGLARAASDDRAGQAAAFIQSLGAELLAIQAETVDGATATRSARLEGLIRRGFDLDLTSQLVLGKYWNRASQAHRQAFKELFAQYLLHNYARYLKAYRVETLAIVSSNPVGKSDFLVETRVEGAQGDDPANPVWRLRRRDGGFKIIDVQVDGISLALTERSQFGSVILRNGLDGMLSALRKRVAGPADVGGAGGDDSPLELHPASLFTSPNVSKIDLLLRQR